MINIAEVVGWYVCYIFIYYLCLCLVFKSILVLVGFCIGVLCITFLGVWVSYVMCYL